MKVNNVNQQNHTVNCGACGAKRGTLYEVDGHLVCLDCSPYWNATTPAQVRKASMAAVTNGKKGYGVSSKSQGYVGKKRRLNWTGKSNVGRRSKNANLVPVSPLETVTESLILRGSSPQHVEPVKAGLSPTDESLNHQCRISPAHKGKEYEPV